jgi:hypothetical protein
MENKRSIYANTSTRRSYGTNDGHYDCFLPAGCSYGTLLISANIMFRRNIGWVGFKVVESQRSVGTPGVMV